MPIKIVEIKARTSKHATIRRQLLEQGARFVGTDRQIDTYFNPTEGRLKLREGHIETNLIFYQRPDQSGPKRSDVLLHQPDRPASLKSLLSAALGVRVVVDKQREIYFIDNVKFHLDRVEGLGEFVEIEAIDERNEHTEAELRRKCDRYLSLFGITTDELVEQSYSDLIINARL